uniref:Putative secreted protein n=1 Tax=Anopheles marajoara TaxID=58244 RepID=A0A2M4C7Q2_9DIPT
MLAQTNPIPCSCATFTFLFFYLCRPVLGLVAQSETTNSLQVRQRTGSAHSRLDQSSVGQQIPFFLLQHVFVFLFRTRASETAGQQSLVKRQSMYRIDWFDHSKGHTSLLLFASFQRL